METRVGDRIVLESERAGRSAREGDVVEVLGTGDAARYRVRWADGHESMLFPSAGNVRVVSQRRASKAARRR